MLLAPCRTFDACIRVHSLSIVHGCVRSHRSGVSDGVWV